MTEPALGSTITVVKYSNLELNNNNKNNTNFEFSDNMFHRFVDTLNIYNVSSFYHDFVCADF